MIVWKEVKKKDLKNANTKLKNWYTNWERSAAYFKSSVISK